MSDVKISLFPFCAATSSFYVPARLLKGSCATKISLSTFWVSLSFLFLFRTSARVWSSPVCNFNVVPFKINNTAITFITWREVDLLLFISKSVERQKSFYRTEALCNRSFNNTAIIHSLIHFQHYFIKTSNYSFLSFLILDGLFATCRQLSNVSEYPL